MGKTLNKKEQGAIYGGEFCLYHCVDECYNSFKREANRDACIQNCVELGRLAAQQCVGC
ncbi:hypothetical protein [Kordia sp. SMS9]|uniref:hypothetical protein n=1 Tax=Kordia sp. SMS9 TaxID=2282170 RepID=UPI00196691E3|nr:hypothetical protein [Kordia sp. SMS9]